MRKQKTHSNSKKHYLQLAMSDEMRIQGVPPWRRGIHIARAGRPGYASHHSLLN